MGGRRPAVYDADLNLANPSGVGARRLELTGTLEIGILEKNINFGSRPGIFHRFNAARHSALFELAET